MNEDKDRQLVRNVGNEKQLRKADEEIKARRKKEIDDMLFVLASEQGRRVMWRILQMCGTFECSFHPSAAISFQEGQRNIGLRILLMVDEADVEAYPKMMVEEAKKGNGIRIKVLEG